MMFMMLMMLRMFMMTVMMVVFTIPIAFTNVTFLIYNYAYWFCYACYGYYAYSCDYLNLFVSFFCILYLILSFPGTLEKLLLLCWKGIFEFNVLNLLSVVTLFWVLEVSCEAFLKLGDGLSFFELSSIVLFDKDFSVLALCSNKLISNLPIKNVLW